MTTCPYWKFLKKNTINTNVNTVEISSFKITFESIQGIDHTLADMMSRLIDIDPGNKQEQEPDIDTQTMNLQYIPLMMLYLLMMKR